MRETATVRLLRAGFRSWPIERGRGWFLRLSHASAPAIFFETDERLCASAGTSPTEVKKRVAAYGYGIFRWRKGAFSPVPFDEPHSHEDLFALKPRHLDATSA